MIWWWQLCAKIGQLSSIRERWVIMGYSSQTDRVRTHDSVICCPMLHLYIMKYDQFCLYMYIHLADGHSSWTHSEKSASFVYTNQIQHYSWNDIFNVSWCKLAKSLMAFQIGKYIKQVCIHFVFIMEWRLRRFFDGHYAWLHYYGQWTKYMYIHGVYNLKVYHGSAVRNVSTLHKTAIALLLLDTLICYDACRQTKQLPIQWYTGWLKKTLPRASIATLQISVSVYMLFLISCLPVHTSF